MGLLKRLLPWYRWSDRWAFNVEHIGKAYPTHDILWTCPDDSLHQILGLCGTVMAAPFGVGTTISLSAHRGSHRFASIRSCFVIAAGATMTASFSVGAYPLTRDAVMETVSSTLPMNFIFLPGDTLQIKVSGNIAGDLYKDVILSSKRWIV